MLPESITILSFEEIDVEEVLKLQILLKKMQSKSQLYTENTAIIALLTTQV
jgi:hypothetical protein